ncbi:MAG: carboxynorspermidine decarboxylase [Sphaerochaetaceae bacterium]|nr:carboxynorspermidine decarboxylase [Sphaerochaetaceae bacterium]
MTNLNPFEVDQTPAFVLEYDKFLNNLAVIEDIQKRVPVRFLLALKGFAMHSVFGEIAKVASGATASSLNEALLAAEFFPEVHVYAPAYRPLEFDSIVSLSTHITCNSLHEYERYKHKLGKVLTGLRINPEYSVVSTELYNPCANGSRLGITASELPCLPDGITGLHVHNLCENGAEELAGTLTQIERLYDHLFGEITWLNLGGGHLVTRSTYDRALLQQTLVDFHQRYPHIQLIMEPGAAYVWETGVLVATVLDVVENHNIVTAILDTSFAAHMGDCLEMPYTPRVRGAKIHSLETEAGDGYLVRLGGSSCLAGDWVGPYVFDKRPTVGTRIVFEDMMHYTMVKTNMFNGIALADIGIWRDDQYTVVRRFSYSDYRNRLS